MRHLNLRKTSRTSTTRSFTVGLLAFAIACSESDDESAAADTDLDGTSTSASETGAPMVSSGSMEDETGSGDSAATDDTTGTPADDACDAEPELRTTPDGVEYVRTPDSCFDDVVFPGIDYEPRYVEYDGLRVHYVEAGPADGEVILMLHGEPTWAYLYRYMIKEFAEAGYRPIAMDFIGMGRSDKPTELGYYTYLGQTDELRAFIEAVGIEGAHLYVQDWGANIGLRLAGMEPELFSSITMSNGFLPLFEGAVPFPPVQNPDEFDHDILPYYDGWPDQQEPFRDEDGNLLIDLDFNALFIEWMSYTMKSPNFDVGAMVEANTWFALSDEDEDAYRAPFPRREYMALARQWPSMMLEAGGINNEAWEGLQQYEKPFLTLYGVNDPGILGEDATYQDYAMSIPGGAGQPHGHFDEASHFLQDDQGEAIAQIMIGFFEQNAR